VIDGEKVLVTGPAGQIAFPLCARLAERNEVWGVARFSEPGSRERVEALGVTTRVVDLGDGDLAGAGVPDDFTLVLHLAAYLAAGHDYDAAVRVNGEGTGLLLTHCRSARAALVMSTGSVYEPHPDPWHRYAETDPLGEAHLPIVPTYSASKIGQEAVARTLARTLGLPTVIARMNVAYGANGGMPAFHLDAVVEGRPIPVRGDPAPYSPIHEDDIGDQLEAILGAASVPATIVNWAGDEAVSVQEWVAHLGALVGRTPSFTVTPVPGTQPGVAIDVTRRLALTGPCRVPWREGMAAMAAARHPEALAQSGAQAGAGRDLRPSTGSGS
jgi:nucleoside-diphosphate-sugar epimerase